MTIPMASAAPLEIQCGVCDYKGPMRRARPTWVYVIIIIWWIVTMLSAVGSIISARHWAEVTHRYDDYIVASAIAPEALVGGIICGCFSFLLLLVPKRYWCPQCGEAKRG
jgi:hypothetical protein